MADRPGSKLYTPNLLSLATQLADFPLDKQFAFNASGRSRTCGSTIELGVDLDADGSIARLGMHVSACAIGQSSAAVMALGARGRSPADLAATTQAIKQWLRSDREATCDFPQWPLLDALKPAHDHPARHSALLLAWTAITQALSSEQSTR